MPTGKRNYLPVITVHPLTAHLGRRSTKCIGHLLATLLRHLTAGHLLAALLQHHGWAALSKATVKSAGNSFAADQRPLLAQLLQRCLHREYDFSAYSEEKLAALITKRCSALKDKVCSQLA